MPSGISDTNQTAEQVQIALLRQAGTVRRIDLAAEMTSFAIDGALTALRRRLRRLTAARFNGTLRIAVKNSLYVICNL